MDQLVAAFASRELFDLATAIGTAPDHAALKTAMSAPARVHLWLPPGAMANGGLRALWTHSTMTGLDRIYMWQRPQDPVDHALWAQSLECLSSAVFEHDPQAQYCFIDLPRGVPAWQQGALLRVGFEPFNLDDEVEAANRDAFGLKRSVWADMNGR